MPQQQRSRDVVARVLDAADRLLADEGASALTTTRLAAEAGVAVGTLYQYFPDTGAIVAAVARRHMDAFEALMREPVEGEDLVGALVDRFAERYRSQPGYRALWFGSQLSDELREADRASKRVLAEGVERMVVQRGLARRGPRLGIVCQAAVHACDALLQEAFRRDPRGDGALLGEAKELLRGYLDRVATGKGP